jgi:hypothetical protein
MSRLRSMRFCWPDWSRRGQWETSDGTPCRRRCRSCQASIHQSLSRTGSGASGSLSRSIDSYRVTTRPRLFVPSTGVASSTRLVIGSQRKGLRRRISMELARSMQAQSTDGLSTSSTGCARRVVPSRLVVYASSRRSRSIAWMARTNNRTPGSLDQATSSVAGQLADYSDGTFAERRSRTRRDTATVEIAASTMTIAP